MYEKDNPFGNSVDEIIENIKKHVKNCESCLSIYRPLIEEKAFLSSGTKIVKKLGSSSEEKFKEFRITYDTLQLLKNQN